MTMSRGKHWNRTQGMKAPKTMMQDLQRKISVNQQEYPHKLESLRRLGCLLHWELVKKELQRHVVVMVSMLCVQLPLDCQKLLASVTRAGLVLTVRPSVQWVLPMMAPQRLVPRMANAGFRHIRSLELTACVQTSGQEGLAISVRWMDNAPMVLSLIPLVKVVSVEMSGLGHFAANVASIAAMLGYQMTHVVHVIAKSIGLERRATLVASRTNVIMV